MPGVGAHGWVAGIAGHGSVTQLRGWLAGWLASSRSPWTYTVSQAPNLHLAMQLLISEIFKTFDIMILTT